MSLITISGYPCSGKTLRAEQIKAAIESRLQDANYTGPKLKVVILSDDALNISRDAYKGLCLLNALQNAFTHALSQILALKSLREGPCLLLCNARWARIQYSLSMP